MNNKKIFGYILVVIVLAVIFATFENSEQAKRDDVLNTLLNIEESTTIDNTLALADAQKAKALEDFDLMEKSIKSPQGKRFVELTKIQNEIGTRTSENGRNMVEELRFIESFDWDSNVQGEWNLLNSNLETLCPKIAENNLQFDNLLSILDEKVSLAKHPNVVTELFGGDPKNAAMMEQLRDSQKRIMDSEKEGYKALCTDQ
jgi:hypothetical protein